MAAVILISDAADLGKKGKFDLFGDWKTLESKGLVAFMLKLFTSVSFAQFNYVIFQLQRLNENGLYDY